MDLYLNSPVNKLSSIHSQARQIHDGVLKVANCPRRSRSTSAARRVRYSKQNDQQQQFDVDMAVKQHDADSLGASAGRRRERGHLRERRPIAAR